MLGGGPTPVVKRKTRNFKGLLLKDTSNVERDRLGLTSGESEMGGSLDSLGGARGDMQLHLPQWLSQPGRTLSSPLDNISSMSSGPVGGQQASYDQVTHQLDGIKLGTAQTPLDLDNNNLRTLSELGSGNGGVVTKVVHIPTGITMAKKVVFIDAKPEVRKQILRELQVLHECRSEFIVGFYGASLSDVHIFMCMEFLDVGSLDTIYQRCGPIDVGVCGKIVMTVVYGLSYLYEAHRIIHRDVKPSNILVNSRGQIKLCDFGVSGELTNSIANTFVGTSTYMSVC